MALKKSDLYSSIWQSCDELRGGMDATQYKDYVLFMLFIKYISDKYGNSDEMFSPVNIPAGASFDDMVALKGKSDIGDKINTKVVAPLVEANPRLARSDFPDFNDPNKLGEGNAMVERLSNLIGIFQKEELNFSKNRADNDDILGDAYEYLMRHFARDSGKSKGQFYTPSEVSRIMAKVIGISPENTVAKTSAYDPTCGSGSLLLKIAEESGNKITLEGQEVDVTTAGLARMNMILHDFPTANILNGNTLANPKFLEGENLKTYDYVVANPPFSDKTWSTGLTPSTDKYKRFEWGEPPGKQGDYAYLLHIIRSLTPNVGKGACILPHGVLFRGNAEATIRKQLIRSGYLKGIIGLPANLFYGTGIPACILILDKENAAARKGIFMIDASKGFIKDGPKNRLRERDIHQIVDVFNNGEEIAGYSRLVDHTEIVDSKNDYNLNLPRYIDTRDSEDLQDIDAHLHGGIPGRDLDRLKEYWETCSDLRSHLFSENRKGYYDLAVDKKDLKTEIHSHKQFGDFLKRMDKHFIDWRKCTAGYLGNLKKGCKPKAIIADVSESLLEHYEGQPLLDPYAIYQHLMDYWADIMQDDCYTIAADGWVATPERVYKEVTSGKNKGTKKDVGWECDLAPKELVIARYFKKEKQELDEKLAEYEALGATIESLLEENGGEGAPLQDVSKKADGELALRDCIIELWNEDDKKACSKYYQSIEAAGSLATELRTLAEDPAFKSLKTKKGTVKVADLKKRLKQLKEGDSEYQLLNDYQEIDAKRKTATSEATTAYKEIYSTYIEKIAAKKPAKRFADLIVVNQYLDLLRDQAELKVEIYGKKDYEGLVEKLDKLAHDKYPSLKLKDVKTLVIEDKWLTSLATAIQSEMDRASQGLTQRISELNERYETPVPELEKAVADLDAKVNGHLVKMGFTL